VHSRAHRLVLFAALLSAGGLALAGCSDDDFEFSGAHRSPATSVADVRLPEVRANDGAEVELRATTDGFLVVYWGYTSCPDICPTTMSDLAAARESLSDDDADRIAIAMATFDPEQDSAIELADYVGAFADDGWALRTDDTTRLDAAMAAFGVSAQVADRSNGIVHYDHTSTAFVIDDTGAIVLEWPFGIQPDAIAADLEHLLDGDDPAAA
jgi:protein SCO1/2